MSNHLTLQLKAKIDPDTLLDVYALVVLVKGGESHLE